MQPRASLSVYINFGPLYTGWHMYALCWSNCWTVLEMIGFGHYSEYVVVLLNTRT